MSTSRYFNSSPCQHKYIKNNYCHSCGAVSYLNSPTSKHIKYNYQPELSPYEIFKHMSISAESQPPSKLSITYASKRKELINLIRNINTKLDFNSQTFFLTIYYMDEIFIKQCPNIVRDIKDYILLSLCCLIISSKFNENDPKIPDIYKYINICTECTKYKYLFTIDDIRNGEVIILHLLQYKLNYYTVYHYITFFFAHGVVFKHTLERSILSNEGNNNITKKKLLEKIYIQSRELLDYFIEDYNDFIYCNCNLNYLIAISILLTACENILKINLHNNNNENVFKLVYYIPLEGNNKINILYKELLFKVRKIYINKISKKNNINNNSNSYKHNSNIMLKYSNESNLQQHQHLMNSPVELNHNKIKKLNNSTKNTSRYSYLYNQNYQQLHNIFFNSGINEDISKIHLYDDQITKAKIVKYKSKQSAPINMSLSINGLDKIKIDMLRVSIKKKASSINKDNNNCTYISNNIYNDSKGSDNNNELLRQTSISPPKIIHSHNSINNNSLVKNKELLAYKYIGIKKQQVNKIDEYIPTNTTSTTLQCTHNNNTSNSNNNILDKTKKIFDNARNDKTSFDKVNLVQETNPLYKNYHIHKNSRDYHSLSNNKNRDHIGKTIIINNNININAYIEKKEGDNNYNGYSYINRKRIGRYRHSLNNVGILGNTVTTSGNREGRYGHFGTHYDYGYGFSSGNYGGYMSY